MFEKNVVIMSINHMAGHGLVGLAAEVGAVTGWGCRMTSIVTGVTPRLDSSQDECVYDADFVRFQIKTARSQFDPSVVKTGMLYNSEIVQAVAEELKGATFPIIVDPKCIKSSGEQILPSSVVDSLKKNLFPIADVVILNRAEATFLSGIPLNNTDDIAAAGRAILEFGPRAVVIKGWGLAEKKAVVTEWLITPKMPPEAFNQPRVHVDNPIGCADVLASSVAAWMGNGHDLRDALGKGQGYLNLCLQNASFTAGGFSIPDLAAPIRIPLGQFSAPVSPQHFGIIGSSRLLHTAVQTAAALAKSDLPVLLLGETGTGKGLFAQYIHALSDRSDKNFISLNCAAIPETLVESVLFGHRKGAFTGATSDLKGQFELADEGTLFLDEVAELPVSSQVKLLRVIETGEIQVLGKARANRVNVRIIAATNQDLKELITQKLFREDLYYRLNVGVVRLPPLRDRKEDIREIAQYTLDNINNSLPAARYFTQRVFTALLQYPWPGNVRELVNVVERSARLSAHRMIDVENVYVGDQNLLPYLMEYKEIQLEEYIATVRDTCIRQAVEQCGGNYSAAARMLGITPQAVSRHMCMKKKK